jgi:signal transduction histidine kinase
MTDSSITRTHSRARLYGTAAGCFAIGVGALVLAGWWWRIDFLKRVGEGMISMNPLTALCCLLAGISLVMQVHRPAPVARALAAVIVMVGAFKLGGYLLGWDFPADRWMFPDELHLNEPVRMNRIAPNTALGFIALGLGLLTLDDRRLRGVRLAEIFSMGLALIASLVLVGYIYQIDWLFGVASHIPMALHTAVTLLVLGIGIVMARPDCGLMAVVTGDSSGGLLARRLIPVVVLVFVMAGGLKLMGERQGYYEPGQGEALYTVLSIGFFGAFVLWSAHSLHRVDQEKKRAEAKLRGQASRLESLNLELEAFSYSVSHDLRAPLRGISGFAQALEEREADRLDPTSLGYLHRIRKAAGFMGELIDDLLELSRLTRAEMRVKPVDLSETAHELISGYRLADPERRVEVAIAPDIKVAGDPALLRAMLDNLLSNAWKFTSRNPTARIEMGAEPVAGGRIRCFVRDNGVGFDNRYAHKLFGAFQRLHSQEEFKGTGIGLATVQRIVRRHGGEVAGEGMVDAGTVFHFTLDRVGTVTC